MYRKVTSDGRIVVWEGGSLWAFDVLSGLEPRTNRLHSHHAFQITLGAGGYADIRTETGLLKGDVILIAPDVPHAIVPEGRIALVFAEPEGRDGVMLRQLMGQNETLVLDRLPGQIAALAPIWQEPRPSDFMVAQIGRQILDMLLGEGRADTGHDPRIARVIDWLKANPTSAITARKAAGIACLSESRFSHLFVEQVCLPFRTYLLWRRLMVAVEHLAGGNSLTAAAHQAGFADSAHFSRTFQRMFGLPAATLELGFGQDLQHRSPAGREIAPGLDPRS